MRKVRLIIKRGRPVKHYCDELQITSAPPYVYTNQTSRVHRIRSATIYNVHHSGYTHIAYNCWCGQTILMSQNLRKQCKRTTLTDTVPAHLPVCGTCEGRAIGAGQDGSRSINGQTVVFTPRI